ncbi:hypothetical protein BJ322DRAFT_1217013 [Thelephora terrestris]|uniref:Uncharacterized protein n=1 Tax=Thelephora terrestris TaxID=56493 RepID=A0A9P6HLC9_9AGAM|nr:hypothetical protein BJ322DRAFT_1217013 [Thelephora terrestris]
MNAGYWDAASTMRQTVYKNSDVATSNRATSPFRLTGAAISIWYTTSYGTFQRARERSESAPPDTNPKSDRQPHRVSCSKSPTDSVAKIRTPSITASSAGPGYVGSENGRYLGKPRSSAASSALSQFRALTKPGSQSEIGPPKRGQRNSMFPSPIDDTSHGEKQAWGWNRKNMEPLSQDPLTSLLSIDRGLERSSRGRAWIHNTSVA